MNRRFVAVASTAAALALAATGCAKDEGSTTDSGLTLVEDETLTICTHLPYRPFEFTEGGEVVGFDIDILKLVADKEEEVSGTEVVDIPWETIVSGEALNTGQCDVAAGAMTITDERAEVMDFTDPYFEATQALLVQEGSGVASLDDLAGERIGVQEGTTGEQYVKDNLPDGAKTVPYEDSALLAQAVNTGKVAGGVNDNGVLYDFVNQNGGVEVAEEFTTGEEYGFSVKKGGNDELLAAINDAIGDKDAYDEVYDTWFGDAAAE